MPGLTIIVILAVIGLSALAGALVTWFVLRVIQRKSGGNTEAGAILSPQETEESLEQEDSPPVAVPPVSVEVPPVHFEEPAPVLSVQDDAGDSLQVYVQGIPYSRLKDIADAEVGYSAVEAIRAILAFAEGWLPATVRPAVTAVEQPAPTKERFVEDLANHNRFVSKPASPVPSGGQHTLADQIDELVQERLETCPDLANLHVKIGSLSNGALFIRVGSQVFDSVDSVSHVEVRGIIQEAIRDWERSQ